MPSLNLRKKITGLTSHPKKPPMSPRGMICCWNFSTASPSTQSLKLLSSTGQPLDMTVLSPLTPSTQHITRLKTDLWGQVRSLSGLSPCTSSTHCTGVGLVHVCHTKAESCWKAELSPHSGACTWWMWECTEAERKGTFGVQLCFNYFNCCYFLSQPSYFLCQVFCHIYFFSPQTRGMRTTES